MNMEDKNIYELLKFYKKESTDIKITHLKNNSYNIKGKVIALSRGIIGKPFAVINKTKVFLEDIDMDSIFPTDLEESEIVEEPEEEEEKPIRKGIPKSVKMELWRNHFGERFEGKCFCCKKKIERDNFESGHVVPVAAGGENHITNLRPICFDCNRSMGDMDLNAYKAEFH